MSDMKELESITEIERLRERLKIAEEDFERFQDGIQRKITGQIENICLAVEAGNMSTNAGYEAIHALYSVLNGYDKDDFLINVLHEFNKEVVGQSTDTVRAGPYHINYIPSEMRILISEPVKSINISDSSDACKRFKNVVKKLREKYDT